jgi:peptidoglycan/xylan/chitin deacetylase (PgdA/CDA1 family)
MHERRTVVVGLGLLGAVLVAAAAPTGEGRAEIHTPTAHLALAPAGGPRSLEVPILMYHRIDVDNPALPAMTRRLTVDPGDFARQMRWLVRNGFRTITQRELFEALVHGRPLGPKPVMITFDDGYRNVFGKASPVLAKLGLKATAYVISSRVSNGDPSFLTWGQLRALEARGIEIGSHNVSHRDLTAMSDARLLIELVESRRTLERRLDHPIP